MAGFHCEFKLLSKVAPIATEQEAIPISTHSIREMMLGQVIQGSESDYGNQWNGKGGVDHVVFRTEAAKRVQASLLANVLGDFQQILVIELNFQISKHLINLFQP